jgi:hypothetical protein
MSFTFFRQMDSMDRGRLQQKRDAVIFSGDRSSDASICLPVIGTILQDKNEGLGVFNHK